MSEKSQANELIDHFFRNESGKIISYLSSKYGLANLELIEDSVQESIYKAMKTWSLKGIPKDASAWIFKVSRNELINQLRRRQKVFYATKVPEKLESISEPDEEEFKDSIIKMMLVCCHPDLNVQYQMILILKILCGLSIREISSGLLMKEESVAKAYTRSKSKFKKEDVLKELKVENEIKERLNIVIHTIYLLFNEGYKSSAESEILRRDICEEAMRLNQILLESNMGNNSSTKSIMALMHYNAARFDTRFNAKGIPISLKSQNRKKWDRKHIDLGNRYLSSVKGGYSNLYFLIASINGFHCIAETYEETNWKAILTCYDIMLKIQDNPKTRLNRIIPLSMIKGPKFALNAFNQEIFDESIESNAIKAELYIQLNDIKNARALLKNAHDLCNNPNEKDFYQNRINNL